MHKYWKAGLLLVPALTLTTSYAILAFSHRTWNLFNRVVHENQRYTRYEKIFYPDHFIRELPLCVLSAFVFAAAFSMMSPVKYSGCPRYRRRLLTAAGAILTTLLGAVTLATISEVGLQGLWLNLLQFQTTDTQIEYGSHWHGHLLHLVFIFFFSISLALLYRGTNFSSLSPMTKHSFLWLGGWWGIFITITVIYRPDARIITDVRYLAHQFREIVTHGLVTVPLSFGILMQYGGRLMPESRTDGGDRTALKWGFATLAFAIGASLFILFQLRGADILAHAQKPSNYLDLFASHYFEHTLDYIFVPCLAVILYSLFPGRIKEA